MAQQHQRANHLWSNWYITVNFNDPALGPGAAVQRAELVVDGLLSSANLWTWLEGTAGPFVLAADRARIQRVRARPSVEQNPGGSPHVHILLEIQHRTRVRLNYAAINALMRQLSPGSNTDIRFVRNGDIDQMLRYGNKNGVLPNVPGALTIQQFSNAHVTAASGVPDMGPDEFFALNQPVV